MPWLGEENTSWLAVRMLFCLFLSDCDLQHFFQIMTFLAALSCRFPLQTFHWTWPVSDWCDFMNLLLPCSWLLVGEGVLFSVGSISGSCASLCLLLSLLFLSCPLFCLGVVGSCVWSISSWPHKTKTNGMKLNSWFFGRPSHELHLRLESVIPVAAW